jgi:hypothetical protein
MTTPQRPQPLADRIKAREPKPEFVPPWRRRIVARDETGRVVAS